MPRVLKKPEASPFISAKNAKITEIVSMNWPVRLSTPKAKRFTLIRTFVQVAPFAPKFARKKQSFRSARKKRQRRHDDCSYHDNWSSGVLECWIVDVLKDVQSNFLPITPALHYAITPNWILKVGLKKKTTTSFNSTN